MKRLGTRLLSVLLILCLLPLSGFAEGYDTEPLYRSNFEISFSMDQNAFPNDGKLHYADWASLLSKLQITGKLDYQRLSEAKDQYAMLDASINLNGTEILPFHYESYGYSRFVTAAKLPFFKIYLNMLNFWEFMAKPFVFMELPTNLLSMAMFWEQTADVANAYLETIRSALQDQTELSNDEIVALANTLASQVSEDEFSRYYYFLFGLFGVFYLNSLLYEDFSYLPDWLSQLDPEQKGLQIISGENETTYILGDTPLLTVTDKGWSFAVTDPYGYELTLQMEKDRDLTFSLSISLDDEETLKACLTIEDLPNVDTLSNGGSILFSASGSLLQETLEMDDFEIQLEYHHERSSALLPRSETFSLSWIHPESGKKALTVTYDALTQEVSTDNIENHLEESLANSFDFFSLNDESIITFKDMFVKPFILTLLPAVLEIPIGIYSDLYQLLADSGFLAMLGVEGGY